DTAAAFSCPPDYPAMAMLAAAGAAIGNARVLELKRSFRASASLFACIVGDPGVTKTPALVFVLRPVHKRSQDLADEHARALAKYLQAKQEQRRKRTKGAAGGQAVEVEEALRAPVEPRIDTSDTTVEAAAALMAHNYRGLLLFREELAGWALSMNL